jgi:hypothetical protein
VSFADCFILEVIERINGCSDLDDLAGGVVVTILCIHTDLLLHSWTQPRASPERLYVIVWCSC